MALFPDTVYVFTTLRVYYRMQTSMHCTAELSCVVTTRTCTSAQVDILAALLTVKRKRLLIQTCRQSVGLSIGPSLYQSVCPESVLWQNG